MNGRPLLVFPQPSTAPRQKLHGGSASLQFPSVRRQARRLNPQFQRLAEAFENKRMSLQSDVTGAVPEQVLVFETAGSVEDFIAAVRRVEGMEWMAEWETEDFIPDDDFRDSKHPDKPVQGRLFLILANQQALQQLLSFWDAYRKEPDRQFPRGLNKWRHVFRQLRNIRPWGPEDRLRQTGAIEDWTDRLGHNENNVRLEAELWFRDPPARERAENSFRKIVAAEDGHVLAQSMLPEAAYHALLAELPAAAVRQVLRNLNNAPLLRCYDVMFFRPVAQAAVRSPRRDRAPDRGEDNEPAPSVGEPIVAIFDGMPLENHRVLRGRLIVDDPDGWGANYPAALRVHGTAMASLVTQGDLQNRGAALTRPVYLRPILRPDERSWRQDYESMPSDVLFPDLIQRAIRRLFEDSEDQPAVAPRTKIVNLSIGDPSRLFFNTLSSWARILDWLSYNYNVLFVVSAGNHVSQLELGVARSEFRNLTREQLRAETLKAVANNATVSRLLAPAESVNALTTGALHADESTATVPNNSIDPYEGVLVPSPFNALGLGFRRAIKPDLLANGGRLLYSEKLGNAHPKAVLIPREQNLIGQTVAAPGVAPGMLTATDVSSGTSNAAALSTREGGLFFEILESIRREAGDNALREEFDPVLLKAALAHGSNWGISGAELDSAFRGLRERRELREYFARFLGYGATNFARVAGCTEQRVTLLGAGKLSAEEAHVYSFPLPVSLSSTRLWRRLIVTLAWFSPINCLHRSYRRAALWFDTTSPFNLTRKDVDFRACQRGTLQHEVFECEQAVAFTGSGKIDVQVNCRADAGELDEEIRYGLMATLEIAENQTINIYDEIRTRVGQRVPIRGAASAPSPSRPR
jgi:Subtilase family